MYRLPTFLHEAYEGRHHFPPERQLPREEIKGKAGDNVFERNHEKDGRGC
jgi:hypothetical protein